MRSIKTLSLALSLLLPAAAMADDDATETIEVVGDTRPERPPMRVQMDEYNLVSQRFVFPTGLVVIMQPDTSQPMIGITTVFDKGSTSDPVGKEGIAHFLEHMWFQTHHGDLPKTWDVLSEIGCDLNASTADDWTNYMSVCPANQLPTLLKLASLRMTDSTTGVPPERIDSEREVIRNELRMRYENGGGSVLAYINGALFHPDHPYARLGIGTHGSLDNITYEDIVKFGEDHYRPENATITIVGDFDPQVASSLIFENFDLKLLHPDLEEKHLFRYPKPGIESPDESNPEHWLWGAWDPATFDSEERKPIDTTGAPPVRIEGAAMEPLPAYDQTVAEYDAPIEDRSVYMAWSVPGAYQGNDQMVQLAAQVVGSFMAQGMDQAAVPGYDAKNGAGCWSWESKHNTKVICGISVTDKAKGDYIVEKAIDQIAPLLNPEMYMLLDRTLGQRRNYQLAAILGSLDRFSGIGGGSRATDIAHHAHYTGRAQYHSDAIEEIMSVNGQQIAQFVEQWLTRDRVAAVMLNPLPEDEITKDSSESDYAGATDENDVVTYTVDPSEVTAALIKEETALPDLDKMRDYKLGNGMRVVVMPHGEAPIVTVTAIAHGGTMSRDTLGKLASRFQSGYDFDILQVAGTRQNWIDADTDHFQLTVPNGNLPNALWLIRENLEQLKPYTAGKPKYISDYRDRIYGNWEDADWHRAQVTSDHVLGKEHPLSKHYNLDDLERWEQWGAGDIGQFLNEVWQPANTTLLIVGKVRPGEAESIASKYFSTWKPKGGVVEQEMEPLTGEVTPGETRVLLFDDERATQTDITLSCPGAPASAENVAARGVFSTLLSKELFQYLRADLGVTYGAYGGIRAYEGGATEVTMGGLFQNDAAAVAIAAFHDAVERYESGDIDVDTMQLVKLNQARKYVLRQQSSGQMTSRLMTPITDRHGWDYISKYPERLAAVDKEQLQGLMGACSEHMLVTAKGPITVLEPALKEAGIAYEVYDHEAIGDQMLKEADPKAYKKKKKAEAKAEKKKAKKGESEESEEGSEE